MFRSPTFRTATILILVAILPACGLRHQTQGPRVAMASQGWRPVPLPFRPIYVTSIADTLWVCGTNEMLAKSGDGGQTWQVKHQKADGEVLLRVHFVGEKTAYAAGTNGLILRTKDGGETWTSQNSGSETILDISFGDDRHGIRHTRSAIEITDDGGVNWIPIATPTSNDELKRFKIAFAVTALDSSHAAILLKEGSYGDQVFLITADGGKTWSTTYIPNVGIRSLVVHNGQYWAFGHEVIEKDKPGGGYGVALAIHSVDGMNWLHGARAPNEFSDCNAQGCILWDGAIVQLYDEKPRFSALPPDGSLTRVWATAQGSVCSVGPALKCASAKPSDAPPPRPEMNRPIGFGPGINGWNPPSGCLICAFDRFRLPQNLLGEVTVTVNPGSHARAIHVPGIQSVVDVDFLVLKDGTVGQVQVRHAPAREIESAISENIRGWVFDPPRQNGTPAERNQNMKVRVSCLAFGSNKEASCIAANSETDQQRHKE